MASETWAADEYDCLPLPNKRPRQQSLPLLAPRRHPPSLHPVYFGLQLIWFNADCGVCAASFWSQGEGCAINIKRKGTARIILRLLSALLITSYRRPNTLPLSPPDLPPSLFLPPSTPPSAINLSTEYSSSALIYSWAHLEEPCLFYSWGRAEGGRCAHKYTVHDQHRNVEHTEWLVFFFSTNRIPCAWWCCQAEQCVLCGSRVFW